MILPLLLALAAAAPAQPPASTTAGSVVRSKEWIVRRGKKREEEFRGDVRYEAAGTKLSSDWALYRQDLNDWQARGHIRAHRELAGGDVVETSGERAQYNQTTQEGTLFPPTGGRISVLRTPPGQEPDHAEADTLSWIGERVGILSGRARGWGPRGEFWADNARYERLPASQTLLLTGGRPVLHNLEGTADGALKADRIVGADGPRRATATGRAIGWVLSQSSPTAPGADPARCGPGGKPGPGPDERVAALLAPPVSALPGQDEKTFWDAEEAAYAKRACPWGPRLFFWADQARYEETPERRLTLDGGRPVVEKLDEDWSTALKADHVVALGPSRRLEATGKVKGWLVFKEDDKNRKKREERRK